MLEESKMNFINETDRRIYCVLEKYRPYVRRIAQNKQDAEDIVQEVYVKLLMSLSHKPDKWNGIENKKAYIMQTVKNVAFDMRRKNLLNHHSIDDGDNLALINNLSDKGNWLIKSNEKLDFEKYEIYLEKIMKDFSEYEKKLIQLIYLEGCKPSQIAQLLDQPYEKISIDCNRAKAKLRGRIKNRVKDFSRISKYRLLREKG